MFRYVLFYNQRFVVFYYFNALCSFIDELNLEKNVKITVIRNDDQLVIFSGYTNVFIRAWLESAFKQFEEE